VAVNSYTVHSAVQSQGVWHTRGVALPAFDAVSFLYQSNSHMNGFYDQEKNYANRCKKDTSVEATLKAG
jgi:hypothetical protein